MRWKPIFGEHVAVARTQPFSLVLAKIFLKRRLLTLSQNVTVAIKNKQTSQPYLARLSLLRDSQPRSLLIRGLTRRSVGFSELFMKRDAPLMPCATNKVQATVDHGCLQSPRVKLGLLFS